jgi:hypothetical protein
MGGHQKAKPLWGAQKPQKHYQWGWQHSWGGYTYKQNAFLHLRCATRKYLSQVRNGKSRNLEQIKFTGEEDQQAIVISKHKPQNWHKLNLRRVFSGSYWVFCERAEKIWDKKKGGTLTLQRWIESIAIFWSRACSLQKWIAPDAIWLQWLQKEHAPCRNELLQMQYDCIDCRRSRLHKTHYAKWWRLNKCPCQ